MFSIFKQWRAGLALLGCLAVTACSQGGGPTVSTSPEASQAAPTATRSAPVLPEPTVSRLPVASATPARATRPAAGGSPLNPLTGQNVASAARLDRRPLAVKVENLPRNNRPQFGLSLADHVYEYYTEQGTTRFIAVFYGQDAERVGPIRSARFFDEHIIRMYRAVFAFGSAYFDVLERLRTAEFADRLVIETRSNCPPMCRYGQGGILVTNTADLSRYATQIGIDNGRQDLAGLTFSAQPAQGGEALDQVFVRFSGAIYNRWDYDAASQRYLRAVDQANASSPAEEVYAPLTDALTGEQIGADNLVILRIPHEYYARTAETEVFEMGFIGSGEGYALRDGKVYPIRWLRQNASDLVQLTLTDGSPYALRPGSTWFEVLTPQARLEENSGIWRFTFVRP